MIKIGELWILKQQPLGLFQVTDIRSEKIMDTRSGTREEQRIQMIKLMPLSGPRFGREFEVTSMNLQLRWKKVDTLTQHLQPEER